MKEENPSEVLSKLVFKLVIVLALSIAIAFVASLAVSRWILNWAQAREMEVTPVQIEEQVSYTPFEHELRKPPTRAVVPQIQTIGAGVPDYASGWVGHEMIDSYIDQYTADEGARAWAKRVYRCESGGNAHAVNKSNGIYRGLFQWHPYYWQKQFSESIWDWQAQVRHSIDKYLAGGAGLWQCK